MALQHELEKAFDYAGIDAWLKRMKVPGDEDVPATTYKFTVADDWVFKEPTPAAPEAGTPAAPRTEPVAAPA